MDQQLLVVRVLGKEWLERLYEGNEIVLYFHWGSGYMNMDLSKITKLYKKNVTLAVNLKIKRRNRIFTIEELTEQTMEEKKKEN